MKKKIIGLVASVVVLIAIGIGIFMIIQPKNKVIKTDYSKFKLDGNESLMVVAHPDDEVLWGGSKLLENDFVVVCITCGGNKTRVKEFEKVMDKTDDKYVMLGYPDKVNGERSDWKDCYEDIENDIENIYKMQDWKEIVTHNPEGEYGHNHHKMTSAIVTDKVEKKDKLIYFGKYYSKKRLEGLAENEIPPAIDEKLLEKKNEILTLYKSQEETIGNLSHMNPYEDYKTYSEWQEINSEENR